VGMKKSLSFTSISLPRVLSNAANVKCYQHGAAGAWSFADIDVESCGFHRLVARDSLSYPKPKHNPGKPRLEKMPRIKACVCASRAYCVEADDIGALFLAITHEGTLLLVADQTPLMPSAIR